MSRRTERVAERIREDLGLLLPQLKNPDIGFVTFTGVEVTPDLSVAYVHVSVLPTAEHPDPEKSLAALRHSAGFLKGRIGRSLRLRVTPELRFLKDTTAEKEAGLSALIREARETDIRRDAPEQPEDEQSPPSSGQSTEAEE